jgi:hypothetical protein
MTPPRSVPQEAAASELGLAEAAFASVFGVLPGEHPRSEAEGTSRQSPVVRLPL